MKREIDREADLHLMKAAQEEGNKKTKDDERRAREGKGKRPHSRSETSAARPRKATEERNSSPKESSERGRGKTGQSVHVRE